MLDVLLILCVPLADWKVPAAPLFAAVERMPLKK